jgi:DNA-binding response OmpR family regulator
LVTERADGTVYILCALFQAFVADLPPAKAKDITVDKQSGQVWVEGKAVGGDLTKLEFALLVYLYERRGEVCSRDEIISALYPDEVRDPNAAIPDSRVDTLVGRLREKIEPNRSRPRYILAVRGRGYKLSSDDGKSSEG